MKQEDVKHIADLARLDLSAEEMQKMQTDLSSILGFVEQLQEVDTDNVETVNGGTYDLENMWREDEVTPFGNSEIGNGLIEMAPEKDRGQVKVKRTISR